MSLITPNTTIYLLKKIPLDNTYTDTLYFETAQDQINYFINPNSGFIIKKLDSYSYQRVNKNLIRVEGKADDYYNCNYMVFQNTSFGRKWFYAFVTSINYINNNVTEIEYELDVLQSWHFDYTIPLNFVERQHVVNDTIGENIEPEPLNIDEYVYTNYQKLNLGSYVQTDVLAIIIAIVDTGGTTVSGNTYDDVYCGATLYACNPSSVSDINNLLSSYIQKPDSVVSMYVCPMLSLPASVYTQIVTSGVVQIPSGSSGLKGVEATLPPVQVGDLIDGYQPKNNKLYTYPFNYIHLDNGNGQELALRYEFFNEDTNHIRTPYIKASSTLLQPVQIIVEPNHYKGVNGSNSEGLHTERLVLSDYPICSWNYDTYRAWVAQNAIPMAISAVPSLISAGLSDFGALHSLGRVLNVISESYKASIASDTLKGDYRSGSVNVANKIHNIYYARKCLNRNRAIQFDNFFTMFGYARNKIEAINRKSRAVFTYVKTVACTLTPTIEGGVPADDMKKISNIYDNGIRWWREPSQIGNFVVNNPPIGNI